jgi:putative heme-binding domain-containing protein
MNNVHGNRVNMDTLERDGSGFVGRHGKDFLVSNDKWFRGINLKTGPEGSVYLSDWYDPQACHDPTLERWDRTNGRMYRVSYGVHIAIATDLRALPSTELIRFQFHSNDWFVDRARLVLQERGPDPEVHAILGRLLADERDEVETLRLLWALHATRGVTEDISLAQLDSPHEYVRAWAVQLACEERSPSSKQRERFVRMADSDPSPVVRLYLASAVQRIEPETGWALSQRLALKKQDAGDPNLPYLVWYGMEPIVPVRPDASLALARRTEIDLLSRFIVRRMANDPTCITALVRALAAEEETERRAWMLAEMSTALEDELGLPVPENWPALYATLVRDDDANVREQALWLGATFGDSSAFPDLRTTLADASASVERRERALDALVRGRDSESIESLHMLAAGGGPLRRPALRALASFDHPSTVALLLEIYRDLDVEGRRDAVNTMSARAGWSRELVEAVKSGAVAQVDVGAFVLRTLASHRDPELDALMAELWVRRPTPEAATARIAELTYALDEDALALADPTEGRALFAQNCAQCHTLFDAGGGVGPELTGSNRSDLDYILTNLVDPNAVIGKEYQVTVAWLHDGRVITGIEKARTDTAVTLQSENETVVVALDEIEELRLSELSTMPEGLLDALELDEIRDLVAYLRSPEQVPLRATPANANSFFDGATLAGWSGETSVWRVEKGEIVGKTSGLERNTWLRSALDLGDFRLTLEVCLVDDAGNSGIQFRSTSDEAGEVSGYQADVGVGWWGKLYEEHGRGLLWDEPGDVHVEKGGWNRYEILATGHRIRTWINGKLCVDLEDPQGELRGIIAFQVHSGGPTEVRFRNIDLELDPL